MVAGPRGKAATRRYAVYRNNVTVSLIEALAKIFPATLRITGPDFFRAMARAHVRASPPVSPLLFQYGRGFPDFIAGYEHAAGMPWLPDVARIERAWLDAYHAADAPPLPPGALAGIAPDRLGDVVLTPHPATRILRSRHPAVSIFVANRREGPVGPVAARGPEDALITRPSLEVVVRHLPPGGAEFLERLAAGAPLGAAAEAALAAAPGFDLAQGIAGLLDARAPSSPHRQELDPHDTRHTDGHERGTPRARPDHRAGDRSRPGSGATDADSGRAAPGAGGAVLAVGCQQVGRLPAAQRRRGPALHARSSGCICPAGRIRSRPRRWWPSPPASAEIVLPILLVLGLGTRLAAFGLLLMTLVVQLTVPEGWPVHLTWAAMALGIMAWGPGRLALDQLIARSGR